MVWFWMASRQTGEIILYLGRDDNIHQSGVALVMTKQAAGCLESWMPVSDRIRTVTSNSFGKFSAKLCHKISPFRYECRR